MARAAALSWLPCALILGLCLLAVVQCQDDTTKTVSKGRFNGFFRKLVKSTGSLVNKAANAAVRFAVTRTTGEEVCYAWLGCFSLKSPWVSVDRPLPAPADPEEIKPNFIIFSGDSQQSFNVTAATNIDLDGSMYDGSKPTFFIVHGYLNNGDAPWMTRLKDALLTREPGANVVLVDWGSGSKDQYLKVAANTRVVGRHIALFARQLVQKAGADPADFHFLGHSLGSHISAYACRNITNCGRITAFDPAGPTFDGLSPEVRLDTDAATFVEAIHTNAKPVTAVGFGMMRPAAHMDFYANGGVDQPGCETPNVKAPSSIAEWLVLPLEAMSELITCSHGRSYEYFTDALLNTTCTMWGHKVSLAKQYIRWVVGEYVDVPARTGKCRNGRCVPLGLDSHLYPARGAFSLSTNANQPYCIQERSDDGQDLETLRELGLTADEDDNDDYEEEEFEWDD